MSSGPYLTINFFTSVTSMALPPIAQTTDNNLMELNTSFSSGNFIRNTAHKLKMYIHTKLQTSA